MGVPTEPILDVMRRSMANLKFEESWGTVIAVDGMRRFLDRFAELIEERHKASGWYGRRAA